MQFSFVVKSCQRDVYFVGKTNMGKLLAGVGVNDTIGGDFQVQYFLNLCLQDNIYLQRTNNGQFYVVYNKKHGIKLPTTDKVKILCKMHVK